MVLTQTRAVLGLNIMLYSLLSRTAQVGRSDGLNLQKVTSTRKGGKSLEGCRSPEKSASHTQAGEGDEGKFPKVVISKLIQKDR